MDYTSLAAIILSLIFGFTFLESSFDKLKNSKGNIEWFTSHFGNSFIKPIVVPVFWILTIEELIAGICFIAHIYFIYTGSNIEFITYSTVFGLFVFLQLFAGQRIAKDYAGASGILPYIILLVLYIYMFFSY